MRPDIQFGIFFYIKLRYFITINTPQSYTLKIEATDLSETLSVWEAASCKTVVFIFCTGT